jgi:hypothetical protein
MPGHLFKLMSVILKVGFPGTKGKHGMELIGGLNFFAVFGNQFFSSENPK